MNKILILALILGSLSCGAQTVTNLAIRVTTTTIVTGVSTNTAQTTLNLDSGTAKEKIMIDGAAWMYGKARANGETNTFDNWLAKTRIKDEFKSDADAFNRAQNDLILQKLTTLLTTQLDLLSAQDLSSLNTIASKAQ